MKTQLGSAYLKAKEYLLSLRAGREYMPTIFSAIHANNLWNSVESRSGIGSTLAFTEVVRRELPKLSKRWDVTTILDASCGDFNWMQHVDLNGIDYIGVDVVPELVQDNSVRYAQPRRHFIVADITCDPLPRSDLILCRDCLIHLSYRFIHSAIANFRQSGAQYLLASTSPSAINQDILTGQCRPLDLQGEPFNLPAPLELINEGENRLLGLWRITDL